MIYFALFALWLIIVLLTIFTIKLNRSICFVDAAKSYMIDNIIIYMAFIIFLIDPF